MRIAVISDVHANEHALRAVLEAIDAATPDTVWCLGDTIGYGPAPNECCWAIAGRAALARVGKHDLVGIGTLSLEDFNEDAAVAARWTREVLDEPSRTFLSALEPTATLDGCELFHASPRDPVWDYVLSAEVAHESLALTQAPVVLVGHSHVALAIGLTHDGLDGGLAPDGTLLELGGGRWLLNPGSVARPRARRRRSPRAAPSADRRPRAAARPRARKRSAGAARWRATRRAHGSSSPGRATS